MSETSGILLVLFYLVAVVAAILVLYGAVKLYLRLRKREAAGPASDVGFVVDTFHGLVAQLKDKERELDVLRKLAEKRAGIMEDYNENILQSVPSGVITLDGNWKVVKVNASAERMLGMRSGLLAGHDFREAFSGVLEPRGRDRVERGEMPYVAANGRRLWLGYSLTPLRDAGGESIGQLFIFTDLTELKALQSQAELRQRLSSLGEMAAGIAHELRNPMGVISGYMRLLSKKVQPELRPTVQAVSEEVGAMDTIIGDFLSFARPREPDLAEVDLSRLVAECASNVLGRRHDVEASLALEDGIVVRGDAVLLRQVFANLLMNALEAQEEGGKISVSSVREGGSICVLLSDAGHGIDEGIRDRIFLPFFTTKEKGTGLGLAVVHRIITSHGGSIELQSGEGGATFRVRLPLKEV